MEDTGKLSSKIHLSLVITSSGQIGVQRMSVLHPNLCYNERCYFKVQV